MNETNVLIVGAGPIGLELAVALRQAGVDYLQLDAGQIGQTISMYPRQARFFSSPERIGIAGVPLVTQDQSKATREEYLAYLRGIVEQFDLQVRTYERVNAIRRDDRGGFYLQTTHGENTNEYWAKHVVLAVGDMHAPRMLHVPGEDLAHVSHYFDEPHRYFRKRLLIVGGRNSAVEAAIRCHRAGALVSISYRRPAFDAESIKYWLMPELDSLIQHGRIVFHPSTVVCRITPTHAVLRGVAEGGAAGGDEMLLPADFVLLLTGYVQDSTLFEMAGVELLGVNRAPNVNPETMESNVPGLFVAGTAVAGTQEKFRLFIENCHSHVSRIVRAITGHSPPPGLVNDAAAVYALPES